mmetsp:Transcript_14374/g.43119  ORF Transcript_14374/g.43119 Transcript_14374/m.43119 type:complete len:248 (-) Transcript_14374:751-1494(-)
MLFWAVHAHADGALTAQGHNLCPRKTLNPAQAPGEPPFDLEDGAEDLLLAVALVVRACQPGGVLPLYPRRWDVLQARSLAVRVAALLVHAARVPSLSRSLRYAAAAEGLDSSVEFPVVDLCEQRRCVADEPRVAEAICVSWRFFGQEPRGLSLTRAVQESLKRSVRVAEVLRTAALFAAAAAIPLRAEAGAPAADIAQYVPIPMSLGFARGRGHGSAGVGGGGHLVKRSLLLRRRGCCLAAAGPQHH